MKRFWASVLVTFIARSQNLLRSGFDKVRKNGWGSDVLSCNLAELWFTLWTLLVRVTNGVHNHLCVNARALTVDLIGELVIDEKEDHKITADTSTI